MSANNGHTIHCRAAHKSAPHANIEFLMPRRTLAGTTRRSDIVTSLLRSVIQSREVRAGERLPTERELARQFGMGRLVVREGLRALESQGVVTVKRGAKGGYYVEDLNARCISQPLTSALTLARISLEDLLEARLGLEDEIIRLASRRATRLDLTRLRENVEDTKRLAAEGAAADLRQKVHDFHLLLAEAAQNPLYTVMMHSIIAVIISYMEALGYDSIVSKKTIAEHEAVVTALESRDSAGAEKLLKEHIVNDKQRLTRRAKKRPIGPDNR